MYYETYWTGCLEISQNKTGDSFLKKKKIIILILQDFLRDFKVFLIYFH